jgi:hypothetical protein
MTTETTTTGQPAFIEDRPYVTEHQRVVLTGMSTGFARTPAQIKRNMSFPAPVASVRTILGTLIRDGLAKADPEPDASGATRYVATERGGRVILGRWTREPEILAPVRSVVAAEKVCADWWEAEPTGWAVASIRDQAVTLAHAASVIRDWHYVSTSDAAVYARQHGATSPNLARVSR